MTQPQEPLRRFTLHISVPQRWWLRHLPEADQAARFMLERLRPRSARLIALDTLEFDVANAIADDLAEDVTPELARILAADIATALVRMQEADTLQLTAYQPRLVAAMAVITVHPMSLADALAVSLSQESGWPLLIADRALYERLRAIAISGPRLEVAWIAERVHALEDAVGRDRRFTESVVFA